MELYLFRHGIAEDAPPGRSDASRALTAEGRQRTAAVAKMARHAGRRAVAHRFEALCARRGNRGGGREGIPVIRAI